MNTPRDTWASLEEVRRTSPLIHNITNYVSMDVAANALLAVGAAPAMIHAMEEVAEFVEIASALVINIGTLSPPWVEGMRRAAEQARTSGRPWVLDPVGAGATAYRTRTAGELAQLNPTVIRGNASEILALAGAMTTTRGVDSVHASDDAVDAARTLAREYNCTVAVTGAVDYVTNGERLLQIRNGHPLMTRVTALGCSLSAIVAAFLAVEPDPVLASARALGVFGLAGELAAREAAGPGTLRWRIMDVLHNLSEEEIAGVRITEEDVR